MDRREYFAKLKDPRWQKLRLEVMERDEFSCRSCCSTTDTLNVHHGFYEWDCDPWDYPIDSLLTLCESCHENETGHIKFWRKRFGECLGRLGLLSGEHKRLAEAIEDRLSSEDRPIRAFHVLAFVLENDKAWAAAERAEAKHRQKTK